MAHLLHKYHSSALFLGIGMLMLFSFCAPAYASDTPANPTFRSTSPFGINQTIKEPATVNINGIHHGTIYKPFSSDHPYADLNPGNGSGGSSDPNDDIGIPGWADTPSEPLPIGDGMGILLLMATMMVGAIFLKQRKQLSESISKSTTSTTNINNLRGNQLPTALKKENTTTYMTTRKQTYQSFFQKLFLLLAFVCVAGQASADKTIYFRPSTTQFMAGWNGTDKTTPYTDVYWTKGTSNFFPIELRTTNAANEDNYTSRWTEFSQLVEASNITGYYPQDGTPPTSKSRFIKISVPDGYNYIVAYRAQWNGIDKNMTKATAYSNWINKKGAATDNVKNQNTIPTKNSNKGDRPNEPELIPTDGRNLLACREGWWDNWYWAYYIPKNNDVITYFANLYDWPNLQLLFGKDIYSIASWTFEHIENTKLYQRTLNYKNFEVGYEQYGFISNPDDKKFSPSHLIDPCKSNTRNPNNTYFNGTVPGAGTLVYTDNNQVSTTYNEVQAVAANMIANRIKTANKYTALQANLLSGSELFIPESGENGTVASKFPLTNGWQDLNHTVTIESYVYNLATKSFDKKSNEGGYITYYTHQLTGASEATRVPASGTNTIDAASGSGTFTAAYTAKTELTAIPKPGYRFAGWYDDAGTLVYSDAHHPHHAVRDEDYTIHARFVANDVKCFKYRVQTCESGNVFTNSSDDCSAKGGTIHITATDGQSLTISKEKGNDYKYQYLYHHDDEIITCTAEPKQNYVFIGWWNNGKGPYTVNPWITQADTTNDYVTARFTHIDNLCAQTINVSGLGSATITRYIDQTSTQAIKTSKSVTVNTWKGKEVRLVATPTTDGYTFVGWYEGQHLVSKELTYTYTATEARNITAYFVEGTGTTTLQVRAMKWNGSTLVYSVEGGTFTLTHSGGVVYKYNKEQASDYDQVLVSHGSPVTFQANINNGYEFIGWFNVTPGRRFLVNSWIMEDPSDVGYADGTTKTYVDRFTAIFAHQDYAKRQTIKIEGPGTVKANYTYYDTSTREITIEQNSSFIAWTGKQVTLTAEPLAGYEFVGWYDAEDNPIIDGVSGNKLTYTATTARTITAKFVSEVNKLTVSVLNYNTSYNEFREYEYEYNKVTLKQGSSVLKESYSSFSHEFNDATSVTLIATPESEEETGYDFVGWYQSDTLVSTEIEISINVIGMQAISARFAPKKCWKLTLVPNSGGTYTVRYGKDKNTYPNNFYSVESSLTDTVIAYMPYEYNYTVSSAKPILGYKFKHHDASPLSVNYYNFTLGKFHSSVLNESHDVVVSFVRDEEQVVYLDLNGKWEKDDNNSYNYWVYAYDTTRIYTRQQTENNETKIKDGTYRWIRMESTNMDYLYTYTLPADTFSHIAFIQLNSTIEPTIPISYYSDCNHTEFFTIPATRMNCMKLKSAYNSSIGDYEDMWSEPPTQVGDFRLVYIEQTVESKDSITVDYLFDDAGLIKKKADSQDIVSLHIYNKVSDDGTINGVNNPEVILQRCTGFVDGKSQWVDIERYMVFGPLRSDKPGVIRMPGRRNARATINYDNGIDAIKNDKDNGSGVWNFVVQQTIDNGNVTAKLLVNQTHRYTGDYYIRTTNAPGQYYQYTHPGNVMKLSDYAAANSDYSHYFIRYVDINEDGTPTAKAGKHPLVKFAIANDYAVYLNHELMINNDRFKDDEYEDDPFVVNKGGAPNLPADASVRFGWDRVTNRLTRAYIANTTIKNNEYLVVEGTNIGSPSGDAVYFTDNSNWLYTIDLNATAEAAAKVKAKMNGQYQYFMGSESEKQALITGNGANTYPIRLLYDFKDDRFTTIYRPDGQLEGTINVNTPLMIERVHNYEPTQIKLTTNEHTVTPTGSGEDQYTQPAYAVMTFLEEKLASKDITHHEKMFYWISFPFNVCIKDVFGLGEYGKYWIMEEYNGAQRAASGLAQNNWKYITKKSAVLSKNVGYVLCLNYSQILQDQLFKSYGSSDQELNSGKLSLYFPSNGTLSPRDITGNQRIDVNLARYDNTTTGSNTAWNHHNWHIIGVPSFANPNFSTTQGDVPFFYQYWHPTDGYAAVASTEVDFYAMHAYMVQYTGDIQWTNVVNNGGSVSGGKSLAAKTDEQADKKVMLRLELQQAGSTLDKTYVQLRNDKGTKGFDMSLDLTKIINAGANIYSIVDNHEMAGNAIPKDETVLPLGVVITAAGEYTFAMPNGTEGMIVELIDYEQGTSTNLLMGDYTITLNEGTFNQRFALRLVPDRVATSVEDITSGTNDDNVRKLLIDGVLYLVKDGAVYDAQGHCVR